MPEHIFQNLKKKLETERAELEAAIAKLKEKISRPINYEKQKVYFQNALNALLDDSVSVMDKNHLLKKCIDRITYHREAPQKLRGKGVGRSWSSPQINIDIKLKV
jgi:hypothetical protein